MILLWRAFNEQSIWLYIVNGVVIAYTATRSYSETKNHIKKREDDVESAFDSLDRNF
jgi:hypothetical protein